MNALALAALGVALHLLPSSVPQWFAESFIDGASTRALWTQFMGFVLAGIGGGIVTARTIRLARISVRVARWTGRRAVAGFEPTLDFVPTRTADQSA